MQLLEDIYSVQLTYAEKGYRLFARVVKIRQTKNPIQRKSSPSKYQTYSFDSCDISHQLSSAGITALLPQEFPPMRTLRAGTD
jgi:DNA-binding winged helix-turn-helix (wHTH) protein